MKKALSFSPILFSVIFLFFSFGIIVSFFGYKFVLYNNFITSLIITILLFCTTICLPIFKISMNKASRVFSAFLLPLSIFGELFFIAGADKNSHLEITIALAFVACCCTAYIFVKYSSILVLTILSGSLSALFIALLVFSLLLKSAFGDLSSDTVVKTLKSSNNTYLAQIINSDQGALGGNTNVEISKTDESLNVIIGKFSKLPKRVYSGKYEEYKDMDIFWKDENTLVINGKEFDMNRLYECAITEINFQL